MRICDLRYVRNRTKQDTLFDQLYIARGDGGLAGVMRDLTSIANAANNTYFDPETIGVLRRVLEEAWASLPLGIRAMTLQTPLNVVDRQHRRLGRHRNFDARP